MKRSGPRGHTENPDAGINARSRARVFVGPVEIAGYYRNLSIGFTRIGVAHDFVTYRSHPMMYGGEARPPALVSAIRTLARYTEWRTRWPQPFRWAILSLEQLLATLYMCQCLARYDVFIFGFGHSLLAWNLDLPILKRFGKKVILNLGHGSELRPPYIDGAYASHDGSMRPGPAQLARMAASHKRRMAVYERHADLIIGAPFSSTQFATRVQVNFFTLGIPALTYAPASERQLAIPQASPEALPPSGIRGRPLRVLHSPSHPACKGTPLIREAIAVLKAKGLSIEYVEIQGRPNHEVLKAIQHCDFVIDQTFSDTPMAGFAMEAAMHGKPAVVCGYGLVELRRFIPEGMYPPTVMGRPVELESIVERLVTDPSLRASAGHAAYDFVNDKWSPEAVARRYAEIIFRPVPSEWWLDPDSVMYRAGCGLTLEQSRANVRALIDQVGLGSLQLSHRTKLESAFQSVAFGSTEERTC